MFTRQGQPNGIGQTSQQSVSELQSPSCNNTASSTLIRMPPPMSDQSRKTLFNFPVFWHGAGDWSEWWINDEFIPPGSIPARLRCTHLQSRGPFCGEGCYSESQGGPYKCWNPHCKGHPMKYDFLCIGQRPFMYQDYSESWRLTRQRATEVLPMAGPWALEIITDGHLRPIGNVWEIQEILQLANRYSRGDQSVGLKVDPDWGKAVAMVEFFREIRGMPIEEHAFGRPANYGFLNVF